MRFIGQLVGTALLLAAGMCCALGGSPASEPATQVSCDYVHPNVLSAGAAAELRAVAVENGDRPRSTQVQVSVEGTVSSFRAAASGRVIRFYFKEADAVGRDGFYCAYFPNDGMFSDMEKVFGGKDGSGILSKRVRVTGTPLIYLGRPQMVLDSVEQVVLLP